MNAAPPPCAHLAACPQCADVLAERAADVAFREAAARLLTERQVEVLRLISEGLTAVSVARKLGITLSTVKSHQIHARGALQARSTTHAVAIAVRHGIIP